MMPGTSSSILLPVLSSIFVFCVCGGRTNLDAGDNGELATSFTSPAGIGDPPAGWKTITLSVEGKSDGRRVEIGDSVDEVEVLLPWNGLTAAASVRFCCAAHTPVAHRSMCSPFVVMRAISQDE